MAAQKQKGRGRFELVADAALLDMVATAAKAADRSVSSYVRIAVLAQLRRDGFSPPSDSTAPPGRPRKESK